MSINFFDIDAMPFAKLLGIRTLEATPARVVAELLVREELCTTNHILHGDMLFPKAYPTARFIYLWILLTPHILLAIVCLPMILITFFLSLTGRFPAHRRLARCTYPIWLYVSVSGVIVYAMLAAYR